MPHFIEITNPLEPAKNAKTVFRKAGVTVREYLAESLTDMSNKIVLVESKPFPESSWDESLGSNDLVVIAPKMGDFSTIVAIISIIISLAAIAVSYFMTPDSHESKEEEADKAYSLRGKSNKSRLSECVEKHYGTVRHWPSYMAKPYNQFHGNDQYLYALFCVGLGKYVIDDFKIDDTLVSNFEDVVYEVYEPGEKVTLFPTNVHTSSEVGGIELIASNEEDYPEDDGWFGPYMSAPPGSKSYVLEVDTTCRQGLYQTNDEGDKKSTRVIAYFERREVDDYGNALGDWLPLKTVDLNLATVDPVLLTFSIPVPEGRYEVRGKRTNVRSLSIKQRQVIHWETLRAFSKTDQDFGNVTLIAVKAKATNNLNDTSKNSFNVGITSILPVYNSGTNSWTEYPTRSPVWAICDIMRASYGKNVSQKFLDLDNLSELAATLAAEGVNFDWTFDSRETVWSALGLILSTVRAAPVIPFGRVSSARDVPTAVPTLGFNGNNIVPDSVSVSTRLVNYSDNDGIEVEYMNPLTWKRETVLCILGTDRGLNPRQVKLAGCTNRTFAYRWGMYKRAVEVYQTDNIVFETGIEAGTSVFGDVIAVRHELMPTEETFVETDSGRLAYNSFSTVTVLSVPKTVLTLPTVPTFVPGETNRISIRTKTGSISGPFACVAVSENPYQVRLDVELDPANFIVSEGEQPLYWFGVSGSDYLLAKIIRIEPASKETITVTAVPYDARVYGFDALPAPAPGIQFTTPVAPDLPAISGLSVRLVPDKLTEAMASWKPSFGAISYIVERSTDGITYVSAGETFVSNILLPVELGNLWVRVYAVNKGKGPPTVWAGLISDESPIVIPPAVTGFGLSSPFVSSNLSLSWDISPLALTYDIEIKLTGGSVLRTVSQLGTVLTYTATQALADAALIPIGISRNLTAKVRAVSAAGVGPWSEDLNVTNSLPVAPSVTSGAPYVRSNLLWVDVTLVHTQTDDFIHYKIYQGSSSTFTPGAGNLVLTQTGKMFTRQINWAGGDQWLKAGAIDKWGSEIIIGTAVKIFDA